MECSSETLIRFTVALCSWRWATRRPFGCHPKLQQLKNKKLFLQTQQQKPNKVWTNGKQCDSSTWQRRFAFPLCTFHHLFGHALGVALLSLLLHQLLQLCLACGDAALIRRRSGYGLHHLNSGECCGFSGLHGSTLRYLLRVKRKLKAKVPIVEVLTFLRQIQHIRWLIRLNGLRCYWLHLNALQANAQYHWCFMKARQCW